MPTERFDLGDNGFTGANLAAGDHDRGARLGEASAIARPSPREPPVTTATRPVRSTRVQMSECMQERLADGAAQDRHEGHQLARLTAQVMGQRQGPRR